MASNKFQNNEDLLKLLEESKELPQQGKSDPILEFKDFYNLIPGNDKVLCKYLFILFKNFRKSPIKLNRFVASISIHLPIQKESVLIDLEASKIKGLIVPDFSLDSTQYAAVAGFVQDCDLSSGQDLRIDSGALYELIKLHYRKQNKRLRLKFDEFDDMFAELLTPVITKKGNVYMLGNGLFKHFTPKEIEDATNGKKENKTLPRKVPKPKT